MKHHELKAVYGTEGPVYLLDGHALTPERPMGRFGTEAVLDTMLIPHDLLTRIVEAGPALQRPPDEQPRDQPNARPDPERRRPDGDPIEE